MAPILSRGDELNYIWYIIAWFISTGSFLFSIYNKTFFSIHRMFIGQDDWYKPYILTIRVLTLSFVTQHYDDVIMGVMASQITSLTIAYWTVYSGADQSKHQSSTSLAFVREIHRGPVNSSHKWPVTRKMFPFDDVIMRIPMLTGLKSTLLVPSFLITNLVESLKWLSPFIQMSVPPKNIVAIEITHGSQRLTLVSIGCYVVDMTTSNLPIMHIDKFMVIPVGT